MMLLEPATALAFGLTAAAIVASPGPDTIVILRHTLAGGRPSGLGAVTGVQVGLLVHTALAGLGISAIIATSPVLFKALALAGALYLAWLGIRLLVARDAPFLDGIFGSTTVWRAGREALFTNLLNPKVLILFFSLYPNFIAPDRGSIATQVAALSAILIAINLIWQVTLVWMAERARYWLARPSVRLGMRIFSGTAFTALAILMVIEHVL
ncbi:MAG: LysE family translocator [Rhodospirillales bacterium]